MNRLCDNRQCIDSGKMCDNEKNCFDKSDENCKRDCNNSKHQFKCLEKCKSDWYI